MEQTISETVYIYSMDIAKTCRLYPTYNEHAEYQLEFYHTKEHPRKLFCSFGKNKKEFSFKVGDKVDIRKKIKITDGLWLKNAIMNDMAQNHSR